MEAHRHPGPPARDVVTATTYGSDTVGGDRITKTYDLAKRLHDTFCTHYEDASYSGWMPVAHIAYDYPESRKLTQDVAGNLVMALSGLGALAIRRAQVMAQQRHQAPPRARPASGGPRPDRPAPDPADAPSAPAGPPKCTETERPVAECDCASRHVATAEGARRYGLPIGSPMGKRARKGKPSPTVQRGWLPCSLSGGRSRGTAELRPCVPRLSPDGEGRSPQGRIGLGQ